MKKFVNITLCLLLLSFVLMISFTSCEKHEHTFGEWETALEPTCRTEGRLERSCECGEKQTESISMIEHEKGEWVITLEPTCTEEGTRERTCVCGLKETETLSKTEHTPSEWQIDLEATIFDKGSKHTYCTRCNITLQIEEIPQVVSQGFRYEINEYGNTCTITGIGTCTDSEIGIPTEIDGYKVVAIGNRAFMDNHELTALSIPETVTHIGDRAFNNCYALERVNIFGENLVELGGCAFSYCYNLLEINIPNSLKRLGYSAFFSCKKLTDINIPAGLEYVGHTPFTLCEGLKYAEYDNGYYLGSEENPYIIMVEIEDPNVETMEIHPDTMFIDSEVFYMCDKLKNIVLPNNLKGIGQYAFYACTSLEKIVIPESVIYIDGSVFFDCTSLKEIVLPKTMTVIGQAAFGVCSNLEYIVLPDGIDVLADSLLVSCNKIKTLVIPQGVTSIGWDAVKNCINLKSITIPDSVTYISFYVFYGCENLTDLYFTGTKEQWENIEKHENWDIGTTDYTIHCTDGDIKKQ